MNMLRTYLTCFLHLAKTRSKNLQMCRRNLIRYSVQWSQASQLITFISVFGNSVLLKNMLRTFWAPNVK